MSPSGLVLVDKPAGITSHDVVSRVRRAARTRKVGHAGTLDPFATGLLVCAVESATRLLPYILGEPKVYAARIAFGTATATDDATGAVVATGGAPDWNRLEAAIASLTGSVEQRPPAFSAKHVDGERAYALARRGVALELPPVRIAVHHWEITARAEDALDVRITCGGGTYIRALARDLGVALGTVAHCATLRREASGPLHVADAMPFEQIGPDLPLTITSPLRAMPHLPQVRIDEEEIRRVRLGQRVTASPPIADRAVLIDADACIVAIADAVTEQGRAGWQPSVVLPGAGA